MVTRRATGAGGISGHCYQAAETLVLRRPRQETHLPGGRSSLILFQIWRWMEVRFWMSLSVRGQGRGVLAMLSALDLMAWFAISNASWV